MDKTRNQASRGFKIILIVTAVLLVLFLTFLVVFGLLGSKTSDPDLKDGIGGMLSYHFSDIGSLFTFNFHNASNIVYFSFSGLLYFFIFIAILYLIFGIYAITIKKRLFIIPALVFSALVVFVFIVIATGFPKYWAIANEYDPFKTDRSLMAPTFAILVIGFLYILAAYILYFYALYEAFKNRGLSLEKSNEKIDENEAQNIDENSQENIEEKPVLFEAVSDEEIVTENEQNEAAPEAQSEDENMTDKEDLKALLSEVIRDIVRDEIARNNANQQKVDPNANNGGPITGATFGGPLVVQYFNGGIQGMPTTAAQAPEVKKEDPQPEEENAPAEETPVEEAPADEAPVEEPAPAPVEESIPENKPEEVVVPVIEPVAPEEKKPIIRIPFTERMLGADKEMQDNYNELKNEILSYGVNSRVSNSGDTFRLHRKTYVKITIAGLSLKLYFALNPDDYKDSTLPIQNAGHKGIYEEIPLVFKVKSGLSMRRCKQLIQDVFDKNGFEQGEIGNTNWVEELKNIQSEDDED